MLPTIKRQNNWLPNIFNDFFREDWFPMHSMNAAVPAINVKENEHAFHIEIAVPGMSKEDFKVHVNDQYQLVVSVENKHEEKEEDKNSKYLRREFSYTHFEQTLQLPENINLEKISAKMCHGVLHIELPKLTTIPEKKTTRVIDIK